MSNSSLERIDPHRPLYHFLPEANWLNDPNGLIQWKGKYHLFYQYNPNGAFHGTIHWGHAVSTDLVQWKHLPIALQPTPDGPDQDGCFSGCAVNNNGVATLIYTGVRGRTELACVATSTDDLLTSWQKYEGNPVIAAPPPDLKLLAYRDHSVWKEGNFWYQVMGAGIEWVGGTALLYRSPDLLRWEYLQPIIVGDHTRTEPIATGEMWECPSLFPLDNTHVLLVSVWAKHKLFYSAYFIGDFVGYNFIPKRLAILDNGGCLYAPQTFLDEGGRRLLFGWLQEQRNEEAQRAAGWSGVMSLPRQLSVLPEGRLAQRPVPELQSLRDRHQHFTQLSVPAELELPILEVQGDCLEIILEFAKGEAEMVGLVVRRSPDGSEQTLISYDWKQAALTIDREQSSLDPQVVHDRKITSYSLPAESGLKLQIFLDRSVLEVFANDEIAMASRIYPTRADSLGLSLVANAPTTIKVMDVWTIGAKRSE